MEESKEKIRMLSRQTDRQTSCRTGTVLTDEQNDRAHQEVSGVPQGRLVVGAHVTTGGAVAWCLHVPPRGVHTSGEQLQWTRKATCYRSSSEPSHHVTTSEHHCQELAWQSYPKPIILSKLGEIFCADEWLGAVSHNGGEERLHEKSFFEDKIISNF